MENNPIKPVSHYTSVVWVGIKAEEKVILRSTKAADLTKYLHHYKSMFCLANLQVTRVFNHLAKLLK